MPVNAFPLGIVGYQDGSNTGGGGVQDPHLEHDEVKTYDAGAVGETNNIYIDEATNTMYIYHTGAYHEISGGGADAFQTFVERANIIEGIEPTIIEIPSPIDNSTASINLNNEIVERWVHDGANWIKVSSLAIKQDGSSNIIERANTVINTAPTILEVADPKDGDTATINLDSALVEHWSHDGTAWSKATSYRVDGRDDTQTALFGDVTLTDFKDGDLYLLNSSTADVNVTLPSATIGSDGAKIRFKWSIGTNVATVIGAVGELIDGLGSFSFNNLNETVTLLSDGLNWNIVGSHLESASGGLSQQGLAVATPTAQGIYYVDGTNPLITLPTATGSQDRYMFHSDAGAVASVIAVQSGDSVNTVLDATHTFIDTNEIILFIDSDANNWVKSDFKIGEKQDLSYTEIGVASTTDAVIAPFDTIVYESVSGAVTTDGSTMTVNRDGLFIVRAKVGVATTNPDAVIKVNGVVVKTIRDGSIENRLIEFAHQFISGDIVTVEALDGITLENWLTGAGSPTTDMNYCQIMFQELPSSASVNVDGIQAVELHYGSMANTSNGETFDDQTMTFTASATGEILGMSVNEATGELTIAQDGLYAIEYSCGQLFSSSFMALQLKVNGVTVNSTGITASSINYGGSAHGTTQVSLLVGDIVTINGTSTSGEKRYPSISVRQMPTHTASVTNNGIDTVLAVQENLTKDRELNLAGNALKFGSSTVSARIESDMFYGRRFVDDIIYGSISTNTHSVNFLNQSRRHFAIGSSAGANVLFNASYNADYAGNDVSYFLKNNNAYDITISFSTEFKNNLGNQPSDFVLGAGIERLLEFRINGSATDTFIYIINRIEEVDPLIVDTHAVDGLISIGDLDIQDKASSNYMDIGDMRICWGSVAHSSTDTRTFPAPFASIPSITGNRVFANSASDSRAVMFSNLSATSFKAFSVTGGGSYSSGTIKYIAIGLKP